MELRDEAQVIEQRKILPEMDPVMADLLAARRAALEAAAAATTPPPTGDMDITADATLSTLTEPTTPPPTGDIDITAEATLSTLDEDPPAIEDDPHWSPGRSHGADGWSPGGLGEGDGPGGGRGRGEGMGGEHGQDLGRPDDGDVDPG
jgi:hypothetical protein